MCFVSAVKARLLALLLVLAAVLGQQRVVTTAWHHPAPVARLASERAELIQSNALRSEVASRLAPAPVFARPPALAVVLPPVRFRSLGEPTLALESRAPAEVACHFHSKRRIPRMNSEEPPRA